MNHSQRGQSVCRRRSTAPTIMPPCLVEDPAPDRQDFGDDVDLGRRPRNANKIFSVQVLAGRSWPGRDRGRRSTAETADNASSIRSVAESASGMPSFVLKCAHCANPRGNLLDELRAPTSGCFRAECYPAFRLDGHSRDTCPLLFQEHEGSRWVQCCLGIISPIA